MSQALKVAVIGVGHLGKWHADKYAASPDCKLLAVVDNNLKSAKQTAQKHGVQAYSDYHDILSQVDTISLLKHIDEFNQNRLRVAQTYNRLLVDTALELPAIPDDRDHVFHQYTLLTDNRDQLRDSLLSQQITCAIFYPIPLHRQKAFADTNSAPLPVTETVSHRCLSFPIFPEMTEQQVQTVCEAILSACA